MKQAAEKTPTKNLVFHKLRDIFGCLLTSSISHFIPLVNKQYL